MLAFVVTTSEADAEVAADVLWQLGVRAIEERRGSDGSVELWTSVGTEPAATDRAVAVIAGRWPHRSVEVDEVGSETWRDHARPMWVHDGLVVVPAWLDDHAVAETTGPRPLVVEIEPGGAFGLGDHPTTLLSLRAVVGLITGLGSCDVLDVGCGTGVIAITAALLQDRPGRGVDLASAAVEATADNARRNGVAERVIVDTTDVSEIEGDYDVVVANILAPVLVAMADDLRRLTRPHGRLVISGILADRHDHVLDALAPMVVERTDELDGWVAVTLRHR